MQMKKFFIPALAVTALFGLSSCSNENEPIAVSGDGVTFAVGLPGSLNTRGSFGDGTDAGDRVTINNLHYTVFEKTAEGYKYVLDSTVDNPFASGDTQLVTIALAKGKTYNVVFYADDSTNNFATYAPQTGVMSVDYSNAASNVEGEDAFTGASGDLEVSATPSKTVTLYRPYAQLNWGTDDINDPILAGFIDSLEGSVKITSGLATSYSLLTGEYDGAPSGDVEFDAVNVKNSLTQTFPVVHADPSKSYSLIAMNYLLTGEGTIDCSLNFTEGLSPVEVNSAPVKPNYRTNIYGSLLTSPTEFNVEIDRNFADNIVADPIVPETPTVDATNKTVTVSSAAQLAGLAAMCNNKDNNFLKGYKVTLENDIDLGGASWTPIGDIEAGSHFSGEFDGNGKTISNLNVSNLKGAGLFGALQGKVKNLTIDGATINSHHWAGVVAGYCTDNAGTSIENVTVKNFSVTLTPDWDGEIGSSDFGYDNGDKAGGLIGYIDSNNPVTGCEVSNGKISGYRDLGGLIGASNTTITNCKVNDVEITHSDFGFTEPGANFGAIVGRVLGGSQSDCTFSGVTINGVAVE